MSTPRDGTRVCDGSAGAAHGSLPGTASDIAIRLDGPVDAEELAALRLLGVALRDHGARLTVTTGNPFTCWLLGATLLDRTIDVRWSPGSHAREIA